MSRSSKAPSKSQILSTLAERTGMTKSDMTRVFDELTNLIDENIRRHEQFTIPNLIKISVKHKKARKARPGINPRTGEEITIKAKPAGKKISVRALKRLKEMV